MWRIADAAIVLPLVSRLARVSPFMFTWRLTFSKRWTHSVLLAVALPSVTKCQSDAERHHSERRHQKYNHTSADGLLSVLGSCFGGAATHGTTLAEGGRSPQQEHRGEKCGANSHFTPNDSIRKPPGKKKIAIRSTQATPDHIPR